MADYTPEPQSPPTPAGLPTARLAIAAIACAALMLMGSPTHAAADPPPAGLASTAPVDPATEDYADAPGGSGGSGGSGDSGVAGVRYSTPEEAAAYRQVAVEQATSEAFGRLYARAAELHLAPDQTVARLLADKPQLRPLLYDQLRQRSRRTAPLVFSDGTVVVQIHVPMDDVVKALEQSVQRLRQVQTGLPLADDLRRMPHYTNRLSLWGYGVGRPAPLGTLLDNPPPGWQQISVFSRLQVRRQAIENAYAQLIIQVQQLRLSPSRRLGDFIAADPRVEAGLRSFIRSFPPAGKVQYLPEGICRASVEVPVGNLVAELRALSVAYDHAAAFPPDRFINIRLDLSEQILRAVGVAVPEATDTAPRAAELTLVASANYLMPDDVPDAEQARILAEQGAMSKIIENFRTDMLSRKLPGSDVALEQYILTHPDAARDVEMLFSSVRLIQSGQPSGRTISVTGEMPIENLNRLLQHYARLLVAETLVAESEAAASTQ